VRSSAAATAAANAAILLLGAARAALAQASPTLAAEVRQYVSVDAPVVALTHVRVIDGTGAPARVDQTVVIERGVIRAVGGAASVAVPAGAHVVDLGGRSVMPGLVMVHEHMYYPSGARGIYNEQAYTFPRLYLAGGVTTMRTGGNVGGYVDLEIKARIEAGQLPGPAMDATAPYLEGPGSFAPQMHALSGPEDARQMVSHWAERGATSFKAYMNLTRAELRSAIVEAHRRGLKLTGHLCSVTFREAAALGIDDLEHGLVVATDFVAGKKPDVCPPTPAVYASIAAAPAESVRALIRDLVARRVAVTSTLTVFETFTPGRPSAPQGALDALLPEAREQYLARHRRIATQPADSNPWSTLFRKEMEFERDFYRAGGLLLAGTDPTGYGGVVAGYSNARELELLVEAGLTPLEAIKVATLNGARYLGRANRVGSIAVGKRADLVVVRGDPSANIADIEQVETVFKDGVGYDSAKLFASAKGRVGLY